MGASDEANANRRRLRGVDYKGENMRYGRVNRRRDSRTLSYGIARNVQPAC